MTTLRELWDDPAAPKIGAWCAIPSSFSAELMGHAGFDWICIDTQHGIVGYENMVHMLQGLTAADTPAFVRVSWNRPETIGRALDAGAQGLIVPMVNTAEDAAAAVRACRYPPLGERSWGPRRASVGVPGFTPETGNRRTVLAVMIETEEALANVEEIAATPGIDTLYVGPSDLALSHGMHPTGHPTEPEHIAMIERILEVAKRHDLVPGIQTDSVEAATYWMERGFRMVSVTADSAFLTSAARANADALRAAAGRG